MLLLYAYSLYTSYVCVTPDENGAENGVDEGLLHSMELNDLRVVTMPMTIAASAIMPSPILLFRFKVCLFVYCMQL